MAKHRKSTRLAKMSTSVMRAVAPAMAGTVAVVTVGATTSPVGITDVAAAPRVSAQQVALKAVITPGSATNWNADGISGFFGIMDSAWGQRFGQDVVIAPFRLVEFWESPLNIYNALQDNIGERNLVLSSGRGAGNASWVISYLAGSDDPADRAMLQDTVWILDNNVDRPNGGYAARLPFFALVGVNPVPTPTDTGAQMIDVGYEYAWNSSVPLYVTNPAGLLNSIIAYAYRYRKQDRTALPAEALEPCGPASGSGRRRR